MRQLVNKPGKFRSGAVGILKGSQVSHIAPKAIHVPELMDKLLGYIKKSNDLDLIKSCVFHYEFEFIHPFEDGNGRLGRFWQTLILSRYNSIFEFIPIESQIFQNQQEYYKVLEACDKKGDSTEFVEWMLGIVSTSLREFSSLCLPEVESFETRIKSVRKEFGQKSFSRLDYMRVVKTVSAPTASRDLAAAVEKKILRGKSGIRGLQGICLPEKNWFTTHLQFSEITYPRAKNPITRAIKKNNAINTMDCCGCGCIGSPGHVSMVRFDCVVNHSAASLAVLGVSTCCMIFFNFRIFRAESVINTDLVASSGMIRLFAGIKDLRIRAI